MGQELHTHPCACMRHTPVISERLMQPARTSTATVTLSKATSSGGTTPPLTGICSAAFESPKSSPAQSRLPAQLLSVPQSSMPSSCAVSPARALPPALAAGFATDWPAGDVASSRRGLMVLVWLSFGKHRCSCLTLQCRSPSSLRHSLAISKDGMKVCQGKGPSTATLAKLIQKGSTEGHRGTCLSQTNCCIAAIRCTGSDTFPRRP